MVVKSTGFNEITVWLNADEKVTTFMFYKITNLVTFMLEYKKCKNL